MKPKAGGAAARRPTFSRGRVEGWPPRGSVTAELAVVLPAVTVLLALLLLAASAGMLQLRLEEGARAGARALARGDSSAQVVDTATRIAGHGTAASLGSDGEYATVMVAGRAGGVLSGLVPWEQTASASARFEVSGGRDGR